MELNDAGATRRTLDPGVDERLARALADGDLRTAARLWTRGARAGWPATGGRRVGLPTYPFDRKRYWLPQPAATRPAGGHSPAHCPGARWSHSRRPRCSRLRR
ncbi:hypothetical protein WJ438_13425 [Streptomyces sp. GD-15H]